MISKKNLNILVIRFSSLGDVILTTALFPNLKSHYPDSHITVLTRSAYAPVFDQNPHVDSVRVFEPAHQTFSNLTKEIRTMKFDLIIDLQGNLKSWFLRSISGAAQTLSVHKASFARNLLVWFKWESKVLNRSVRDRILDCLQPLEIPFKHGDTELFTRNPQSVLETFHVDTKKKLIGIAPGAKHATKRWDPVRFAEAANRLGDSADRQIILLGGKEDKVVAQSVANLLHVPYKNLVGWTSLSELFAVVSQLSFLLTNDSGIMHVGEAIKIPLVALFGPTVRKFGFAPYRTTSRVVEVINLKCRPCSLHGDEKCPLDHHNCMKDIDLNAVLYAASQLQEASLEDLSVEKELNS